MPTRPYKQYKHGHPDCYIDQGSPKSVFTLGQGSRVSFGYIASSDCRILIYDEAQSLSRSGCIQTCPLLPTAGLPSQSDRVFYTDYGLCRIGTMMFMHSIRFLWRQVKTILSTLTWLTNHVDQLFLHSVNVG